MSYCNPTEYLHDFYMDAPSDQDGKPLADARPRLAIPELAGRYALMSNRSASDWNDFYAKNFDCPESPGLGVKSKPGHTAEQHIDAMWNVLERHEPKDDYTRIGLPNPTIVPGERFSESYYWDGYPTMLGLAKAGKWEMVRGMVDNCAYQIRKFDYVPNGARTYYLGRSQPPVFSHMVRLLAQHNAEEVTDQQQDEPVGYEATLVKYLPEMKQEHEFWMEGRQKIVEGVGRIAADRVVMMPDGSFLNRYYDANNTPRPESYKKDIISAREAGIDQPFQPNEFYRNIRAAAESGWDFSGRWFADGRSFKTINTTDIVPVDLNCLLYDLETTLADAHVAAGDPAMAGYYAQAAQQRAAAINKYNYDAHKGFYYDYNRRYEQHTNYPTLAAAFALYSGIAGRERAGRVTDMLKNKFLLPGGFATSLQETKEQWDGENLWAILQEFATEGCIRNGFSDLAATGMGSYITRNLELFDMTRQFYEKQVGGDLIAPGDGGEYPCQPGFGMTNGVLRHRMKGSLSSH